MSETTTGRASRRLVDFSAGLGTLPGWDDPRDVSVAQGFAGLGSRTGSALLLVPSVVNAPRDTNGVVVDHRTDAAGSRWDRRQPSALTAGFLGRDAAPCVESDAEPFHCHGPLRGRDRSDMTYRAGTMRFGRKVRRAGSRLSQSFDGFIASPQSSHFDACQILELTY